MGRSPDNLSKDGRAKHARRQRAPGRAKRRRTRGASPQSVSPPLHASLARCASLLVQHHTAAAAAISARSVDAPFLDEKERKEAREQNYNGEEMDDADDVVGFLRRTPPSGGGRTGGRL